MNVKLEVNGEETFPIIIIVMPTYWMCKWVAKKNLYSCEMFSMWVMDLYSFKIQNRIQLITSKFPLDLFCITNIHLFHSQLFFPR